MPIETKVPIERISQPEFHSINEKVLGLAFRVHCELGRFCNERIYQNALHDACVENGLASSGTEIEVRAVHKDFRKSYFIDLLVGNSVVFETKTVAAFLENHRKQLLHYLMLLGLFHGTLLNFRTPSLQHEFVSTQLTPDKRRRFSVFDSEWLEQDPESKELKTLFMDLLSDWGAFLDTALYTDAVTHFLGGVDTVLAPVEITHDGKVLGTQKVHMLSEKVAYKITAATKNIAYYKKDLLRFLSHTNLKSIQWINLNHHDIEFRTLTK